MPVSNIIQSELSRLAGPGRPTKWVTRARPKIDRIACPWLILRFIDPNAEFIYVPAEEVFNAARSIGAVAYDIPGAPLEHDGPLCTFDAFIRRFDLNEPGLDVLSAIVRGADTAKLDLAPQSAGLLAISLGLSRLYQDDQEMLRASLPIYDALHAWTLEAQHETHNWVPVSQ